MAVAIQTTSYPIFSSLKIELPFFGGSKTSSKSLNITWNISKTTVTGARLVLIAHTDKAPSDYIILFNGNEIYRKDWAFLAPTVDDVQNIDISTLLQNGVNSFSVTFETIPTGGATFIITSSIEVDFQATTPGETPIPPTVGGTIGGIPLVTIALVGGGAFLILILAIVLGGRKK